MTYINQLTKLSRITFVTYLVIIISWIIVWILKEKLLNNVAWLDSSYGSFIFWTISKIFLWLLPSLWLLRISQRSVSELYSPKLFNKTLLWGLGAGMTIFISGLCVRFLTHQQVFSTTSMLLNTLIVAPLFEEFLMRGAIMGNLQKQFSPLHANIITAVMFVGLHIPGWYFMGNLQFVLALNIFIVGIIFGIVAQRGNSVTASTITHFMNNLVSI